MASNSGCGCSFPTIIFLGWFLFDAYSGFTMIILWLAYDMSQED